MPYKNLNKADIEKLDKVPRLKMMNSLSGYKSATLIGTISSDQKTNLAIFSSVTHFGSNPAIFGFVTRPTHVQRDTYYNIIENEYYTMNHVHTDFIERAHQTSASLAPGESEFKHCNFEEEYLNDFMAPYVKESKIKYGLKLVDDIKIPINGTRLILGEVQDVFFEQENFLEKDGNISLADAKTVTISGLDSYYEPQKLATFQYIR